MSEPLPRLIAEGILRLIEAMTKRERARLGMLLSRNPDTLPGYRIVTHHRYAVVVDGLAGQQHRLCDYLRTHMPTREGDVIRHLWPAEAAASADLRRDKRLRSRLRQLQFKTNKNLLLFGHYLFIGRDRHGRLCIG
jgi:hypothetical protein